MSEKMIKTEIKYLSLKSSNFRLVNHENKNKNLQASWNLRSNITGSVLKLNFSYTWKKF